MSVILAIVLGGLIGWLGARIMGREEGALASIVIGIIGAFIGSFLAQAFGDGSQSYLSFSWAGVVWTLVGAIILSAILNAFQHRSTHHTV